MRNIIQYILLLISVILILLLISPIEISFVVSDSMSPTIEPNEDIFFVNTNVDSTEDFKVGEVIVYYSPNRTELTTHRVVDKSEEGLITKGDNSFETDQERGEDPITDELIFGKVVKIQGSVLTINDVFPVVKFVTDYNTELLFGLLLMLFIDILYPRSKRGISRFNSDVTTYRFMLLVTIILVVSWTGFIYFSSISVTGSSTIVTDDRNFNEEQFISVNESVEKTQVIDVHNSIIPTHDEYEITNYGEIQNVQKFSDKKEVHITYNIGPFQNRGVYTPVFVAYPYPRTLPPNIISYLHSIHPLVASIATMSVIAIPIYIIYMLITDNVRIRTNRIRMSRTKIPRFIRQYFK